MSEEKFIPISDPKEAVKALNQITVMYNERGEIIRALKAELKLKEEKLSEFQKGIPIEKADKKKEYLYWYFGGTPVVAEWSKEEKRWFFFYRGRTHYLVNAIVYPSQISQTQEGS